jgi:hypothetical protein
MQLPTILVYLVVPFPLGLDRVPQSLLGQLVLDDPGALAQLVLEQLLGLSDLPISSGLLLDEVGYSVLQLELLLAGLPALPLDLAQLPAQPRKGLVSFGLHNKNASTY